MSQGKGILSITIKETAELYASYMPFVKNGGLFIKTSKRYKLGDDVFMLLDLMGSAKRIAVAAKVVWVTPVGSHGNKPVGIGVQFSEEDKGETMQQIEGYLDSMSDSKAPTYTM